MLWVAEAVTTTKDIEETTMPRLPKLVKLSDDIEKTAVPWWVKPNHWGKGEGAVAKRQEHRLAELNALKGKLGDLVTKKAPSTVRNKVGKVLAAAAPFGIIIGGSLAAAAAIAGVKKAHEAATRDRDFGKALGESPRLRKDKTRAYKHFLTLRNMNSKLSKDPMIAAGYMNKAMSFEQEGIDPSIALALRDNRPDKALYDPMGAADVFGKMTVAKDF